MNSNKCKECNGTNIVYRKIENGDIVSTFCNCYLEKKKNKLLKIKLKKAGIENNYKNSFADYIGTKSLESVKKLKLFVEKFKENFSNQVLFFYGPMSCQKTELAFLVAKKLIEKNIKVKYFLLRELLDHLLSFHKENNEYENINLDNLDCIIIDNLDPKREDLSIIQSRYLENFLRKRIEQQKKSTIIINRELLKLDDPKMRNHNLVSIINRNTKNTKLFFNDDYYSQYNPSYEDIWAECEKKEVRE